MNGSWFWMAAIFCTLQVRWFFQRLSGHSRWSTWRCMKEFTPAWELWILYPSTLWERRWAWRIVERKLEVRTVACRILLRSNWEILQPSCHLPCSAVGTALTERVPGTSAFFFSWADIPLHRGLAHRRKELGWFRKGSNTATVRPDVGPPPIRRYGLTGEKQSVILNAYVSKEFSLCHKAAVDCDHRLCWARTTLITT